MAVQVPPINEECNLADIEVIIIRDEAMLLVSDRVDGLHLFAIEVLIPGFTFVELISTTITKKIAEVIRISYIRRLEFPT